MLRGIPFYRLNQWAVSRHCIDSVECLRRYCYFSQSRAPWYSSGVTLLRSFQSHFCTLQFVTACQFKSILLNMCKNVEILVTVYYSSFTDSGQPISMLPIRGLKSFVDPCSRFLTPNLWSHHLSCRADSRWHSPTLLLMGSFNASVVSTKYPRS